MVVVIAVIVVIVIAVAAIALLAVSSQPTATFVDVTKVGASGTMMRFDVTIRTTGATIAVDGLHLNIESIRNSVTYDSVQYYNLDQIPSGTTFRWDVEVAFAPALEPDFTYRLTLTVRGSVTDSTTVS